ncbi:hypothetical protein OX90_10805 [Pseudomonas coronafaciens pv. porri]|uniref:Uncharacterized protein n=1 Tax=Pseudomonas coronafaciens pv. porri TaxID=83964 RepID=A0ABR5JPZ0_9PSED|nr:MULTISPECIES: hypothetical protein [Pseudomonas syringae group]KOP59577.1 hypothetical protein OX90_10805 [Pseudomonas coronafaciens pv. porri]MCF5747662.1 hypothetical protein [Pseudomonas tremae]RMP19983.1 hypothetical protein ALQ25_200089 [Pseudomonas coronafaciens pv. atropurpurea]RMU84918.1 hypothetical protein ALP22_200109 [Pseudomonas coronafaciens pv. porri]UQB38119.1 hypothetical protein I9H09_07125 [Pseudomonas tremae]
MTRDEEKVVGGTIVVTTLAALITYGLLKFVPGSEKLSWSANFFFVFGVAFAFVILGGGLWCELQMDNVGVTMRGMIPLAVASAWGGLWPAMAEWGAIGPSYIGGEQQVAWWAAELTRYIGLFFIIVGGYIWMYCRRFD